MSFLLSIFLTVGVTHLGEVDEVRPAGLCAPFTHIIKRSGKVPTHLPHQLLNSVSVRERPIIGVGLGMTLVKLFIGRLALLLCLVLFPQVFFHLGETLFGAMDKIGSVGV